MSIKMPGGTEGGGIHYDPSNPLKDLTNNPPTNSNGNKDVIQRLSGHLHANKDISQKTGIAKERVTQGRRKFTKEEKQAQIDLAKEQKKEITEPRLKKASAISKISSILTKISKKSPLIPLSGENANDVYISDLKSKRPDKTTFVKTESSPENDSKEDHVKIKEEMSETVEEQEAAEGSEEEEFSWDEDDLSDQSESENLTKFIAPNPKDPVKMGFEEPQQPNFKELKLAKNKKLVSNKAEALAQNKYDVVFKPGMSAATRANICYGLTQLFPQFENVIAPTKKGQATVISKMDQNVERQIVYNPESEQTYLINEKSLQHKIVVKVTGEWGDITEGILDKDRVKLLPVEGHPGFFQIKGIPQQKVKGINVDYTEDTPIIGGPKDEIFVMLVTPIPSRIDQWANEDTEWNLITIKKETFLIPNEKIVRINKPRWFALNISGAFEGPIDTDSRLKLSTSSVDLDNLRESDFEIGKTSEDESEDDMNYKAVIDGIKYQVILKDNDFKLTLSAEFNSLAAKLEELKAKENNDKEIRILDDEITKLENEIKTVEDQYTLAITDKKPVLVPKSTIFKYTVDENKDEGTISCDGKDYTVLKIDIEDEPTFELSPAIEVIPDEKSFVIVNDSWLEDHSVHQRNSINYVNRNNMEYTIHEKGDKLEVVGENLPGMAQLKVEHTFQIPLDEEKTLNLLLKAPARTAFYERIDMPSFIEAFLAVVLLRPQDGKVGDLGESNILFQALPNKEGKINPQDPTCTLRPVIIDLDETMPPANDFTQNPEFLKDLKPGQKSHVHAVRNGLMGFPQAKRNLSRKEKELAVECLKNIVARNLQANQFLMTFLPMPEQQRIRENAMGGNKENSEVKEKNVPTGPEDFGEAHIKAYNDVVDKLKKFLEIKENSDWSLRELFFFVFPEYAAQWNQLGNMTAINKAQKIGFKDLNKS